MFKTEILTGLDIDAPEERVWAVLTDLGSYPEWNPMIRRASGELKPGATLTLRFHPAGRKEKVYRPRLLAVEQNRELRWLGKPGVRGFLESQHYFFIENTASGKTRLRHGMVFRGMLVPLLGKWLETSTREPFEKMNRALKVRSEA